MCGIVGYVGPVTRAQDVLIDGLRRLEYRGYDSAGVAIFETRRADRDAPRGRQAREPRERAARRAARRAASASATRAGPRTASRRERNAHPHLRRHASRSSHNGIIENYRELRAGARGRGPRRCQSDTDTELIAHLVDASCAAGKSTCSTAVRARPAPARWSAPTRSRSCRRAEPDEHRGRQERRQPDRPRASARARPSSPATSRRSCPTRARCCSCEDGELRACSRDGVTIIDVDGAPVERRAQAIQWDPVSAEKGGYDRFMQKEIFEQPRAISDTIGTRVREDEGDIDLDGIDLSPRPGARASTGVQLVACGTAWHACDGRQVLIEQLARHPVRRRSRERVPLPRADRRRTGAW